jgi:hypothetical protein
LLADGDGITRIVARFMVVTARETVARVPGVRVAQSRPSSNIRSDRQTEAVARIRRSRFPSSSTTSSPDQPPPAPPEQNVTNVTLKLLSIM